jgi:hypothetical protein
MNQIFKLTAILLISGLLSPSEMSGQSTLEKLTTIRQGIKSKRISSYDRSGGNNDRLENIRPGETVTFAEIQGAGVINHIWVTIAPEAPRLNRSDIILRIYWDGEDYPSVESPIGPFFGQGWDETYHWASLPLACSPVKGNAMVSYFQMPFTGGARFEIENQADVAIDAFYFYIDYLELEKPPDSPAYFHAWYNYQVTEAPEEGEQEQRIISIPPGARTKFSAMPITDMRGSLHAPDGWAGPMHTVFIWMIPSTSTVHSGSPSNTATTTA